ncbi:MAG: hypothetical protein H6907_20015 [Hyphomicrobiales bacterium]|nr:hypothetical protein [Hyphomicrobiales bacterium]MCP5374026.1 hypothetical protein [Hyphomicrobiales bacterium]
MKKVLIIIGVLIVIAGGVGYYFFSNLDSLIKQAVEKYGTEITKADVTLNKVELSLTSGEGALHGLTVGNPAGYKTDSAFRLGTVSVKVDTATVTADPVVIKEIVVDGPEVTYELGGDAGSNVQQLQKNVNDYVGPGGESKDSGGGPKLIIEHLYVRNGKVNVASTALAGKKLGAGLPEIHLTDIGKDKQGATPGEVAEKVMASLSQGIGKAVSGLGLDKLKGAVTEGIGKAQETLKEGAGGVTKSLQEGTGGATGGIKEGVGDAGKKLKKLFD